MKKTKELGHLSPELYSYKVCETAGHYLDKDTKNCAVCGYQTKPKEKVFVMEAVSDSYDPTIDVRSAPLTVCKFCAETLGELEKYLHLINVKTGGKNESSL